MNAFWIILAACPVLLLGVVAFFVFIVVGVRKGDRADLASPPRSRMDAITRAWPESAPAAKRVTANARNPSRDNGAPLPVRRAAQRISQAVP